MRALSLWQPWASLIALGGRWAWVLEDVRPLREPLPLRGRQGLWALSESEAAEVLARAAA